MKIEMGESRFYSWLRRVKGLKILWLLMLLPVVFALSACSSSTGNAGQASEKTTKTENLKDTENQERTEAQENVVYEDDNIKASFVEVSEVAGQISMAFALENKSDHEITVYPMNSSVNDVMVQFVSGIPATMQPGKKANQVWMANPDVVGAKADDVKSIELCFYYDDVTTDAVKIDTGELS